MEETLVVELFYAGAEQPVYMRQLVALGAKKMAISYYEWQRRHSTDELYKHIPHDMEVCITSGIARKTDIDFKSFVADYIEFAERNAEQALVYDLDAPLCPLKLRREARKQLSMLPNLVMFPMEDETLASLAVEYERVGVNARLAKSTPTTELRRVGATLYGSNVTDAKVLLGARFAATTSFAWLSAHRFGELWVFSRGKLKHYKADDLARAVKAHRSDIEALGVDPDACAKNDKKALTAIAVISLDAMAASLSKRRRDRQGAKAPGASANGGTVDDVDTEGAHPGAPVSETAIVAAKEREHITLPVIRVSAQATGTKVESTPGSVRVCDTCYLSEACPKYEPEHTCAFDIPIEIKTDEQWESACRVIMESQFQRVMFGVFAEQTDGGGASASLGREMDRFYKQLESIKTLKAPLGSGEEGAFTRLFKLETVPLPVDPASLVPQLGSPDNEEDTTVSYEDSFADTEGGEGIIDVDPIDEDDEDFDEDEGEDWGPEQSGSGTAHLEENSTSHY